jgi:hypothetical protein
VDNAVDNALKNVGHRSHHYPQVILVKKPSKKNFPLTYQRPMRRYDYWATGTNDNQFAAAAEFQNLELGCAQHRRVASGCLRRVAHV